MHREATARLLSICFESLAVAIQFLLVGSPHITKPFAVGLDPTGVGISRTLFHLLVIWLGFVHIQSVDSGAVTEL